MKKVCHMSSHHSPVSVRIFKKQCVSLAKNGYRVFYAVPGNGPKSVDGVSFEYVKDTKGLLGRIFLNPLRVYVSAKKVDAAIYHFHDPELIFLAFLVKISGKKVIYDVHENLPAKCFDAGLKKLSYTGRLIVWIIDIVEKFFANKFDFNITVNEDIGKRFRKEKTGIITNYPILSLINYSKNINQNKTPSVIYAGLLNKNRGIREIVDAMGYFDDGQVKLVLMGSWQDRVYKEECMKSVGWKNCIYYGQIPLNETYGYMKSSVVGLVNFLPLKNHLYSMPNKAFEYMAFGMPIVMSDFKFWKQKFSGCAMFVDPTNPKEISDAISKLISDKSLREKLGAEGRKIVEEKYSWESESKKLISIYSNLLKV